MGKIRDYYDSLMPDSRYVVVLLGMFIFVFIGSPLLIIVHEGSHLISAIMLNFEVTNITLEPFYGVVDIRFHSEQNTLLEVGLLTLAGGLAETVLLLLISDVTVPQVRFLAIPLLIYAIGESCLMMCYVSAKLAGEVFALGLCLDIVRVL